MQTSSSTFRSQRKARSFYRKHRERNENRSKKSHRRTLIDNWGNYNSLLLPRVVSLEIYTFFPVKNDNIEKKKCTVNK